MCPIAISSANPLYQSRLNDPTIEDDRAAPLLRTAEIGGLLEMEPLLVIHAPIEQVHARRFSFATTTNRLQPYIESQANWDPKGYLVCGFSAVSLGMSILIFSLHCIEKYHEKHQEILTAQIINILLTSFKYLQLLFTCPASCIKWSQKAARWLSPNHDSEQRIVLASASRIVQKPTNCFWPAIQWWARLDNNDYYLYDGLKSGSFITAALSFILHLIEKKHDNHMPMLWLEGANVCFNVFLTAHDVARIAVQEWGQPSLLPQNVIRMSNYQTI